MFDYVVTFSREKVQLLQDEDHFEVALFCHAVQLSSINKINIKTAAQIKEYNNVEIGNYLTKQEAAELGLVQISVS